jgi:hypothetical protein
MNVLFRTGIKDHQCGFKIIDRDVARTLAPMIRSDHFMFDAELIVNAKCQGISVGIVLVDWLEKRARGKSRISAPRAMLTMVVDLALLRLGVMGSNRLIHLKAMDAGFFTDLTTGKRLPAHITVVDTNHSRAFALLRKLYLTVAFRP